MIRAATLAAHDNGWEVFGIRRGYMGLLNDDVDGEPGMMQLCADKRARHHAPGRHHPGHHHARQPVRPGAAAAGRHLGAHRSLATPSSTRFRELEIDALIAIGGDGSLKIAHRLFLRGLRVVGVPKTIDNDLGATDMTFGFQTAVDVATEAIGRLHSTAEAHQRVMVAQVMGRHTGWIALESGLAGGADVILIPEIPYSVDRIVEKIARARARAPPLQHHRRGRGGQRGRRVAQLRGRDGALRRHRRAAGGRDRARHAARRRARSRWATSSAAAAPCPTTATWRCASARRRCTRWSAATSARMVALQGKSVRSVPLGDAVNDIKRVPVDGEVVRTARRLGVSFGD